MMPHESFLLMKHSWLSFCQPSLIKELHSIAFKLRRLHCASAESIRGTLHPILAQLVIAMIEKGVWPFQSKSNLSALRAKIERLPRSKRMVPAGGAAHEKDDAAAIPERLELFGRLADILSQEQVHTVIEFGGLGAFARYSLMDPEMTVDHAVCCDDRPEAVDIMFERFRQDRLRILPVLMDFSFPLAIPSGQGAAQRCKSDAVVALEFAHHLAFRRGIRLDFLLKKLMSFAGNLVIIEWDPMAVPNYQLARENRGSYSIERFQEEFQKCFEIVLCDRLQQGRMLFVGKVSCCE